MFLTLDTLPFLPPCSCNIVVDSQTKVQSDGQQADTCPSQHHNHQVGYKVNLSILQAKTEKPLACVRLHEAT